MSRPRSTELADRNDRILEMSAQGYSQRKIASTLGISGARVNQILREAREAIDPDAARAKLGEILDEILEDAMKLAKGPGKRLVSPSGKPVYELDESVDHRGNHGLDLTKPLYDDYAKLDAIKNINEITRNYANVFGLNLKPKDKDDSEAMGEVARYIEFLERQVREQASKLDELQPVEGEIVSLSAFLFVPPACIMHRAGDRGNRGTHIGTLASFGVGMDGRAAHPSVNHSVKHAHDRIEMGPQVL